MSLAQLKPPRLRPANDTDPREEMPPEVIDLASRNAFPAVTQHRPRSDRGTVVAGIAVVAFLGGVTFWSLDLSREAPKNGERSGEAPALSTAPVASTMPAAQSQPSAAPVVPPQAVTTVGPNSGSQFVLSAPPRTATAQSEGRWNSPTVVFDAISLPQTTLADDRKPTAAASSAGDGDGDFASRIGGVGGGTATAVAMVDPQTTVTQGTLIPAILETAIDTDVPGFVRAMVSRDVRSFDGSRILIPRSSRVIGQYKSGLQAGQKRAYVIWTRLIRPDGASVALASPGTDFAGRAGLSGDVKDHFFKRFGSAILLSVVSGLSAVGTGGASVIAGGGQSAAAAAVGRDGQIGPTVRVRQGEPIRIFTARDLDFSKVTPE